MEKSRISGQKKKEGFKESLRAVHSNAKIICRAGNKTYKEPDRSRGKQKGHLTKKRVWGSFGQKTQGVSRGARRRGVPKGECSFYEQH